MIGIELYFVPLQENRKRYGPMAMFRLSLSTKTENGKKQIMVRANITHGLQVRLKTGAWISPAHFDEASGEFCIPKRGKLNYAEVEASEAAKARAKAFTARVESVVKALPKKDLTADAIREALRLAEDIRTEDISAYSLKAESMKADIKEREGERLVRRLNFFELAEYYISKHNFSLSHEKAFRVLVRMLARYEAFVRMTDRKRKDFVLDADTMTKGDVEDFFDYVRNEKALSLEYPKLFTRLLKEYPTEINTKRHSPRLEERGENTIKKLQRKLRSFFRWLNVTTEDERPLTTNNPCTSITIGSEKYGTPYYLTLEERNRIADADLEKLWEGLDDETKKKIPASSLRQLNVQRDIFIFQCLVGCRVGDLLRLTQDNVIDGELSYYPNKTIGKQPVEVSVPLNVRAMGIVEKYKDTGGGRLLPFISAQRYNDCIKDILTVCGVTRMVTILNPTTGREEQRPLNEIASNHMCRRTFIGCLYEKRPDPSIIAAMSGHAEGSRAFARYRNVTSEVKKELVGLIE
ncbi:MAG: recombinase [Bacteroidaceae bacterium]|nr:recombinase [Bacteroidaceae bacterium]